MVLLRQIKLGSRGKDVVAVKRALARAGYGKLSSRGTKTPLFGPFAVQNLKKFQKSRGIPASGVFGVRTFKLLLRYFDLYSKSLYAPKPSAADLARAAILNFALYFERIQGRVHYTQSSSRMSIVRRKLRPPVYGDLWEDCSSFATGLYWLAGAPDPNHLGYNGQGYTGTLSAHGKVVSLKDARPGDLVFYGSGHPWHHVAIYVGSSHVVSHGSEGGPDYLHVDYRSDRGEIRSYL